MSPAVIPRLKDDWAGEYERWRRRDLLGEALRLSLGGRRLTAGADARRGGLHVDVASQNAA